MKTQKLQDETRLIVTGGTKDRPLYLVEEAPRHRLALFGGKTYSLPLPWLYYIVVYNKARALQAFFGHRNTVQQKVSVQTVYCSPKKIRKVDAGLDWLPVGATAPHQACHYGVNVEPNSNRLTLVHKAITNFWATNANNYLAVPSKLQEQLAPSVKNINTIYTKTTYQDWEKLTIEQVLGMTYENRITMEEVIKQVKGNTIKHIDNVLYHH